MVCEIILFQEKCEPVWMLKRAGEKKKKCGIMKRISYLFEHG